MIEKNKINIIKTDFLHVAELAGIQINDEDIQIENLIAPHTPPSSLPNGRMAVYVFFWNNQCLKVGKVGSKSQARFTSQHYHHKSSNSNLSKSVLKDKSAMGISQIDEESVGDWIRQNTDRINFLLPDKLGIPTLSLLEAFLHCRMQPRFEGFETQR